MKSNEDLKRFAKEAGIQTSRSSDTLSCGKVDNLIRVLGEVL